MEKIAVIVAGGSGQRMQSDLPKQFLLLKDRPILMHTLAQFAKAIEGIQLIVVLPVEQIPLWKQLCNEHKFSIKHTIAEGGSTRFNSVKNGLAHCPDAGIVGIHDGVRPMVSEALIQRCFAATEKTHSALPVVQVTQSLRRKVGASSQVVSREGMLNVQTPQCFDLSLLKPAFEADYDASFTDDATVFEKSGHEVHLVEGEETNLKITTRADLKIAEALMDLKQ